MESQYSQHCRELNSRVSAFPAADVPWGATAFPTLQHPQSVPSESSYRCPDPLRPHGYNENLPTVDSAGNNRQDEAREDMSPPVENTDDWGQPQDPRNDGMVYYDMTYDNPPPHGHRDHDVPDYAGVDQADPTEAPVNPPAHDINTFDNADQHVAPGPAQPFLDEWPQQDPISNRQAAEYFQRIAIYYLHEPNLQVSFIHMEPSHHAGGIKVVITLETAGL